MEEIEKDIKIQTEEGKYLNNLLIELIEVQEKIIDLKQKENLIINELTNFNYKLLKKLDESKKELSQFIQELDRKRRLKQNQP
jgi:phosphoribosyl-ATP pyrophosphohydrolase